VQSRHTNGVTLKELELDRNETQKEFDCKNKFGCELGSKLHFKT
jgi:hypothetical protein